MKFNRAFIKNFAYVTPEKSLTSQEIERELYPLYERLKMSEGRLELMTGIQKRHFWDPGTLPSTVAAEAGKKLLEKENLNPQNIDRLICASVCRDQLAPASAIHHHLSLGQTCPFFDLSNACLGVMNAVVLAGHLIEKGAYKNILITSGENSGPLLLKTLETLKTDSTINRKTIKKYFANLTIGSAAVAFLISNEGPAQILGGVERSDSSAHLLCRGGGDVNGLSMETNSEELMKKGVILAERAYNDFKNEITLNDQHSVLTHQVGSAHEKLTLETLGLLTHPTFRTYPEFGNTGSAALPLTFMKAFEENKLQKDISLLGIGSGLTCTLLGIQCR